MARSLHHLDPTAVATVTSYADIPPPVPDEDTSDYEHYQQGTRHRGLTSVLLNTSYSNDRDDDARIPSYDESVAQSRNNSTACSVNDEPANPTASGTSTIPSSMGNNRSANRDERYSLKRLGLNVLNARQHFLLTMCRDSVMVPSLYYAFQCFNDSYRLYHEPIQISSEDFMTILTSPSSSEFFLTGLWSLVAAYLSFSVIDGLMIRWIVTYQTTAAIVRVLALSLFLITVEQAALSIFSPHGTYTLHTWILISCILTGAYILQNFVTSNLDLKNGKKSRSVDYYNITVFAVVPIGIASFVSMCALLRSLLILRLDVDRSKYSINVS